MTLYEPWMNRIVVWEKLNKIIIGLASYMLLCYGTIELFLTVQTE